MYKFTRLLSILGCALALASASSWAIESQQVSEIIAKADSYRLNSEQASKVVSLVALYQDEQLDKTREYNVYTRPTESRWSCSSQRSRQVKRYLAKLR